MHPSALQALPALRGTYVRHRRQQDAGASRTARPRIQLIHQRSRDTWRRTSKRQAPSPRPRLVRSPRAADRVTAVTLRIAGGRENSQAFRGWSTWGSTTSALPKRWEGMREWALEAGV